MKTILKNLFFFLSFITIAFANNLVIDLPMHFNFKDSSTNSYHATEYGTFSYTNSKANFNGSNSYATVETFPDLENFTLSLNFKINSLDGSYNTLLGFEAVNDEFLLLFFGNDPTLRVERKNGDSDGIEITKLELNKTYNLVFINDYTNGIQKIYIDNILVNTFNVKHDYETLNSLKIGHENSGQSLFNGEISDLKIYNSTTVSSSSSSSEQTSTENYFTYPLKENSWHLYGAVEDLNPITNYMACSDTTCTNIWVYRNDSWKNGKDAVAVYRGEGFWIKHYKEDILYVNNTTTSEFSYLFSTEWNLVGATADILDMTSLYSKSFVIYGYENEWIENPTKIAKGMGFWVKANDTTVNTNEDVDISIEFPTPTTDNEANTLKLYGFQKSYYNNQQIFNNLILGEDGLLVAADLVVNSATLTKEEKNAAIALYYKKAEEAFYVVNSMKIDSINILDYENSVSKSKTRIFGITAVIGAAAVGLTAYTIKTIGGKIYDAAVGSKRTFINNVLETTKGQEIVKKSLQDRGYEVSNDASKETLKSTVDKLGFMKGLPGVFNDVKSIAQDNTDLGITDANLNHEKNIAKTAKDLGEVAVESTVSVSSIGAPASSLANKIGDFLNVTVGFVGTVADKTKSLFSTVSTKESTKHTVTKSEKTTKDVKRTLSNIKNKKTDAITSKDIEDVNNALDDAIASLDGDGDDSSLTVPKHVSQHKIDLPENPSSVDGSKYFYEGALKVYSTYKDYIVDLIVSGSDLLKNITSVTPTLVSTSSPITINSTSSSSVTSSSSSSLSESSSSTSSSSSSSSSTLDINSLESYADLPTTDWTNKPFPEYCTTETYDGANYKYVFLDGDNNYKGRKVTCTVSTYEGISFVTEEIYHNNGKIYGVWKYWHTNGQLKEVINYNSSGEKDGNHEEYYSNGVMKSFAQYTNSKLNGYLLTFYTTGSSKGCSIYSNGEYSSGCN